MEALHKQTLPFLLRRVKEYVLQDLPPKIIQDYYCELSPLQVCGCYFYLLAVSTTHVDLYTALYYSQDCYQI